MRQGKSLVELATELERQIESRRDFVAPAGKLSLDVVEPRTKDNLVDPNVKPSVALKLEGNGAYPLTTYAHGQLAEHVEIPARYYQRMQAEAPQLLAENVNTWLRREPNAKRLVRTLDGRARAFLSDRYHPLDNHDLADVVLPELISKGARVVSAELTETRLYIKAILEALEVTVPGSRKVGDVVQAGLVISNSEVGAGALRIEPMLFRLICLNGAIAPTALKRYHVGKAAELETEVRAVLTDETKRADDKALWLKVRDVVRSSWDREIFMAQVNKWGEATQQPIEAKNLAGVVEVVTRRFSLGEGTGQSILKNLIEGGDLSRYGLANAITAVANDESTDYEAGTDLQRIGGQIVELPASDWKSIASATA